jgi:hypothetical protein
MAKLIKRIKTIRVLSLVAMALFSLECLITGLVLPLMGSSSCGTGGCGGGFNIINIIFGALAGYWFLKEFDKTRKWGTYNSSNWVDLQWLIVAGLFILSAFFGMLFYVLAIIAVVISFVKSDLYMEWYAKLTNN